MYSSGFALYEWFLPWDTDMVQLGTDFGPVITSALTFYPNKPTKATSFFVSYSDFDLAIVPMKRQVGTLVQVTSYVILDIKQYDAQNLTAANKINRK